MNGITSIFSDVNKGFSTMGAPELGGAFAHANSGALNTPVLGYDNNATLEI
mgnify:CR=1 FL=1